MSTDETNIRASSLAEADVMKLAGDCHQAFQEGADEQGEMLQSMDGKLLPIACRAGCAHCCSIYVTLSVSELILIRGYIRTLPEQVKKDIAAKVVAAVPRVAGKGSGERARNRVRCPLLDRNGRCLVYDARPLACRAYVSSDSRLCKRSEDNPDEEVAIGHSRELSNGRNRMLLQLLKYERDKGLPFGTYELIQSLDIVLGMRGDLTPILNGERVLDSALEKL